MARKLVLEITPGRPEPPPERRRARWAWVAAGAVAALALAGGGYALVRATRSPAASRSAPVRAKPAAATGLAGTGTVASAQAVTGRPPAVVGSPSAGGRISSAVARDRRLGTGTIRVRASVPGYAAAFLDGATKRLRADAGAWQDVPSFPHTLAGLPPGLHHVRLEAVGFDCSSLTGPDEAKVIVAESATNELEFVLSPKPATLTLQCNVSSALVQIGGATSAVSRPLSVPSLLPVSLTATAPGFRPQAVDVPPLQPGATARREIALVRGTGGLRASATTLEPAQSFLAATEKRVRLGTDPWESVASLPREFLNIPGGAIEVALDASGFQTSTQRAVVLDGATAEAAFVLTPRPSTLIITCNATNAAVRVSFVPYGSAVTSRFESAASTPLSVPCLTAMELQVSATGYVPQALAVSGLEPGRTVQRAVQLEPIPPLEEARPLNGGLPRDLEFAESADDVKLDRLASGSAAARDQQLQAARQLNLPVEVKSRTTAIRFRLVPGGTFAMGSPASEQSRSSDELQHTVKVTRPFYMGKLEVTQEQWQRVMGENPSHFASLGGSGPVEKVRYMDCTRFCEALCRLEGVTNGTYRLPTEAEWEYACRAGTVSAFCYGEKLESGDANCDGNYPYGAGASKGIYRGSPLPVGAFRPNAWGFYDMHGNVSEWCADTYREYAGESVSDPAFINAGGHEYVTRGGNWSSSAKICRSACRGRGTFGSHGNITGLRVVRQMP